jgi:hypothetical protein
VHFSHCAELVGVPIIRLKFQANPCLPAGGTRIVKSAACDRDESWAAMGSWRTARRRGRRLLFSATVAAWCTYSSIREKHGTGICLLT